MSLDAPLLGDNGDSISYVHSELFPGRRSTHVPAALPPTYLRAGLCAAIRMLWQDNPRTQSFMAKSVQRIARCMRDDGASPEVMLRAFKTILADELLRVSDTRGAQASEDLRLRITGWAVEEFFRPEEAVAY